MKVIDIIGLAIMAGLATLTLMFTLNQLVLSVSHDKQCADGKVTHSVHPIWWSGLRRLPAGELTLQCPKL